MVEALQTRRPEAIGSDAFRIEYSSNVSKQAVIDDIISYLGEYRFSLPKFSYDLKYSGGKIRDPHRNDPMEDVSQRAINLKKSQNKSSLREQAEKLAFNNLDKKLISSKEGQTILWASPPGAEEEGYGDYGFFYVGKIGKKQNGEGNIRMTAIRIENPTIEQFNEAFSLLSFAKINHSSPEEFLANPQLMEEDISEEYIDSVLKKVFSFKPNEEEQKLFHDIIKRNFSLIDDVAESIRDPWKAKAEKLKEFYSLENYVIMFKDNYDNNIPKENVIFDQISEGKLKAEDVMETFIHANGFVDSRLRIKDIVGEFGFKPKEVRGSCGSTSSKDGFTSSNIFSRGSVLNSTFNEDSQEWFTCPKCSYKADGPIGNTCPGCGLTKEAYAEESGVSCD